MNYCEHCRIYFPVVAIGSECDDASTVCSDSASKCIDNICSCSTDYQRDPQAFDDPDVLACKLDFQPLSFGSLDVVCGSSPFELCSPNLQCRAAEAEKRRCQCPPDTAYISFEYRLRNPRVFGVCQQGNIAVIKVAVSNG